MTSVPRGIGPPAPLLSRLRRALRPRTRVSEIGAHLRKTRFGLRPLHNLLLDFRFGGWCGGRTINPFADRGAYPIQSIDYAVLDQLHQQDQIAITPSDVLVDVGCGHGRVLNWWLSRGLTNRLIGLELVPEVARRTARRLRRHPNVEVLVGDAPDLLPVDGTFFFLYSPFDREVMRRFRDAVAPLALRFPSLRILYFNSRFVDLFEEDPRWRVQPMPSGEPEPAALILPAPGLIRST